MSRPFHRCPVGIGLAALVVGFLAPTPARSQLSSQVFPPATVFRNLQLTTLACSRENNGNPCDQARRLADPLLDHPLLSASCKDVLWDITQKARPSQNPGLERRDGLDKLAGELPILCRPGTPPPGQKGKSSP
jgi:hypothetical protein